MNKKLSEAIIRVSELPEDRQQAAAALLLDFLDHDQDFELTSEQMAEIERRLQENDILSDKETKDFFDRMRT
jgi:hypothetical protein